MSMMPKMVRQTLTIARRDFTATVFTPTFLIFLLAPLLMFSFGAVGGMGAAVVGKSADAKQRIYAVAAPADAAALKAADDKLRALFLRDDAMPPLVIEAPKGDPAAQARALLNQKEHDVPAVMSGPLDRPLVLTRNPNSVSGKYLAMMAEQVLRTRASGGEKPLSTPKFQQIALKSSSIGGKSALAFLSVTVLFVLTLMLSSQAVGTMAEERTNKVIEVLAASVPLESVFLGKLIGMFGVAILFIAFWGGLGLAAALLTPADKLQALTALQPAIGLPMFVTLFGAYFAMAYMLLGAVFLGIGAQASTPREIQLLSLPITIFQMAMLGLASAAVAAPGTALALFAEIFPFSSPFAMVARGANEATLWPHLMALAWQLFWVALSITIGARLFRRGVLQSAGPKFRFGRRKQAAEAAGRGSA